MAAKLPSQFTAGLEQFADKFGLMTGDLAPMKRFAVGAGVGYVLGYVLKPGVAWSAGKPRPFGYGKPKDGSDLDPTLMPAWLITVLPGAAFALLV